MLHRGDLCTLKADDKVIVKVVSGRSAQGRRDVRELARGHDQGGQALGARADEPGRGSPAAAPRRAARRCGARLVRVSCMDGFHDGVVRSVEQFGYEVRFADGDEGFVSLKQAHEAAARSAREEAVGG